MSLINETYFQNDANGIYIPSVGPNNGENTSSLLSLISQKEKEVLIDGLGFELYTEFMDNLTDGDKFQELNEGKTYPKTIYGKTVNVRWDGLINTSKDSLIAYYTYFYWMQDTSLSNSLTGVVQNSNENSVNASARNKMVAAWNNFYKLYQGDPNSTVVSLGQFIYDMNEATPDTYDSWIFKSSNPITRFFN